jgi:hypothetical protein
MPPKVDLVLRAAEADLAVLSFKYDVALDLSAPLPPAHELAAALAASGLAPLSPAPAALGTAAAAPAAEAPEAEAPEAANALAAALLRQRVAGRAALRYLAAASPSVTRQQRWAALCESLATAAQPTARPLREGLEGLAARTDDDEVRGEVLVDVCGQTMS